MGRQTQVNHEPNEARPSSNPTAPLWTGISRKTGRLGYPPPYQHYHLPVLQLLYEPGYVARYRADSDGRHKTYSTVSHARSSSTDRGMARRRADADKVTVS